MAIYGIRPLPDLGNEGRGDDVADLELCSQGSLPRPSGGGAFVAGAVVLRLLFVVPRGCEHLKAAGHPGDVVPQVAVQHRHSQIYHTPPVFSGPAVDV